MVNGHIEIERHTPLAADVAQLGIIMQQSQMRNQILICGNLLGVR